MRGKLWIAAVGLGLGALGSAWAVGRGGPPAADGARGDGARDGVARLVIPDPQRRPAPEFTVRTTSGRAFSLSGARGRVVVMSFLAPGCADCTAEVMALKAVHQELASRGVDVLLVDLGGLSDEEILDYYRREIGGGPHLYAEDAGFKVAVAYDVQALSTTVVVDRRGRVAYRDEELTPAAKLLAVVQRVAREA